MRRETEFDIVVYGATGYTGALVAEHLSRNYGGQGDLRWALAGRSQEKLKATRTRIGADDVALLVADGTDVGSVRAMAERTKIVLTTAGPYRPLGATVVEACAASGTDYLDLSGEPAWMRQMIEQHEATAQTSGARIMFACGFDSLPSELGVWLCQQVALKRTGKVVPRVKGRVRSYAGGISGGSVATRDSIIDAVTNEPGIAELMKDPFCLTPWFRGAEQPAMDIPYEDPDVGPVVPFMLGPTNAKAVHRSNLLLGHPYGPDFAYDEMLVRPSEGQGPPGGVALPKPGEGPSEEARAAGSFDMLFIGNAEGGQQIRVSVQGDQDPGYGSTSKMIAETALCLQSSDDVPGGMWTPVAAMQRRLSDRLEEHAGLTLTDETDVARGEPSRTHPAG